jgi:hypothetical protein
MDFLCEAVPNPQILVDTGDALLIGKFKQQHGCRIKMRDTRRPVRRR